MPGGNGRGPFGLGPGTGRGRGWCRTGIRFFSPDPIRGKNRWLLGFAVPVIAAALHDLSNPQGLLRRIAATLLPDKRIKDMRRINDTVHYTVMETSKTKTPDKTTNGNGNRNV